MSDFYSLAEQRRCLIGIARRSRLEPLLDRLGEFSLPRIVGDMALDARGFGIIIGPNSQYARLCDLGFNAALDNHKTRPASQHFIAYAARLDLNCEVIVAGFAAAPGARREIRDLRLKGSPQLRQI